LNSPAPAEVAAEVDRAGVAPRQNPAVVDLDAQNTVVAAGDRRVPPSQLK
jgi:hypothetical protein